MARYLIQQAIASFAYWQNSLCLGILLIPLVLTLFADKSPTFFANDQATDLMVAEKILSGEPELRGPPTARGSRHIGATYYYFVAFCRLIGGEKIESVFFVATFLKWLGVSFLLIVVNRVWIKSPVFLFFGALCFSGAEYLNSFNVFWHSNYHLFITSLTLGFGILTLRVGSKFLPAFLLLVFLYGVGHLSAGPPSLGMLAVIILFHKRLLIIALVCSLFLFKPAIEFASAFGASEHGGIISSIGIFSEFFRKKLFSSVSVNELYIGLFFLVLISLNIRKDLRLWIFILTPCLFSIIAVALLKPPLFHHFFYSLLPLPALIGAIVLSLSVRRISSLIFALPVFYFLGASLLKINPPRAEFQTLEHTKMVVEFLKKEPDYRNLAVLGSLSSKHSRNSYYYLLKSHNRYNMQYIDRFPDWIREEVPNKGVLVICPRPYSKAREDIFNSVKSEWIIKEEIAPFADNCSGWRLQK